METNHNNFTVRAKRYNQHVRDDTNVNFPVEITSSNEYFNNIYVNSIAGIDVSSNITCVSAEYGDDDIKLSDGFNCIFRADSFFENNNGNNGCIAFAWTNQSLGANALPVNTYGGNYSSQFNESNIGSCYGLLGSSLEQNGIKGFTLTLYPETTTRDSNNNIKASIHQFTGRVGHFILTYKNTSGGMEKIEGSLPESIDIYFKNSIFVNYEFGQFNFYLNGKKLASIDNSLVNMETWEDEPGYIFTASMLSAAHLDANLEIIDISYCPIESATTTNEEVNNNESV